MLRDDFSFWRETLISCGFQKPVFTHGRDKNFGHFQFNRNNCTLWVQFKNDQFCELVINYFGKEFVISNTKIEDDHLISFLSILVDINNVYLCFNLRWASEFIEHVVESES